MMTTDRQPDFIYDADVMTALLTERARQRIDWSAAHDYGHTPNDWAALLTRHVGRFLDAPTEEEAQRRLIQVAALSFAAIQAIELWRYGPNPAAALNALAARLATADDPPIQEE